MAKLSPAAQAVNSAYMAGGLAAALRAVAKLEDIEPGFVGPSDESYGSYLYSCSITQRDFNYRIAVERNKAQVAAERKLLAIAAELRGEDQPISEEPQ